MKNLALMITAIVLCVFIMPIAFCFAVLKSLFYKDLKISVTLNSIWFQTAKSLDQMGNANCYLFFNAILIKKDNVHQFGNEDETISSVLGINKRANNLTVTGRLLDWILSVFEENHTIKSIGQ